MNEFLDEVILENSWKQSFKAVLSRPLQDAERIIKRREFLSEILGHTEVYKFTRLLSDRLEEIKRLEAQMKYEKSQERKTTSFFMMMKKYYLFIKDLRLKYDSIKDLAVSDGFKQINLQLENEINDNSFDSITNEINSIYIALTKSLKQCLGIRTMKGIKISHTLHQNEDNTGAKVSVISGLCYELGIRCNPETAKTKTKQSPTPLEILNGIHTLNSNTFSMITNFYNEHQPKWENECSKWLDLIDSLQFYLGASRVFKYLTDCSMNIARAEVLDNKYTAAEVRGLYDLSLVDKKGQPTIVTNDWIIPRDNTGFCILTGANQGGKTTYLRAVGIAQLLFQTCGHINGAAASMRPLPGIYTHFPREEDFSQTGRLNEEIKRVNEIMNSASEGSLVLFNETYSSTSAEQGMTLGEELMRQINKRLLIGIFVTHLHDLAWRAEELGVGTLTALVDTRSDNHRLYKIVRAGPGGYSYAREILLRYGMTRELLQIRLENRITAEKNIDDTRY